MAGKTGLWNRLVATVLPLWRGAASIWKSLTAVHTEGLAEPAFIERPRLLAPAQARTRPRPGASEKTELPCSLRWTLAVRPPRAVRAYAPLQCARILTVYLALTTGQPGRSAARCCL